MPKNARWFAIVFLAGLAACESAPESRSERVIREASRGDSPSDSRPAETSRELRVSRVSPPAMLEGEPIEWLSLHDAMVEAAGATALEEQVLDRLLAREAERRGINVASLNLQREELALEDALSGVSGSPAERRRLLQELRDRRGLGPERYEALLRRTAIMRALVRPSVEITPEMIDLAMDIRYGEKRRVRLISVGSAPEAQAALTQIERGRSFGEVAARLSTDASAERGGLIEPFSVRDPSYPAAFREAAGELEVGEVSEPVALPNGFAIIKLEEIVPAQDVELATVRPLVLEDARAEQERILMTRLARRLIDEANLTIVDPALERAWNRRRNQ
jgi:foldase protein PrsA